MTLYRLSHYLGDGNMYYQHFIDDKHEYSQEWLDRFIEDAKTHHNPDYALNVEVFEPIEKYTVRPVDDQEVYAYEPKNTRTVEEGSREPS